jgi:hypothetical protein
MSLEINIFDGKTCHGVKLSHELNCVESVPSKNLNITIWEKEKFNIGDMMIELEDSSFNNFFS